RGRHARGPRASRELRALPVASPSARPRPECPRSRSPRPAAGRRGSVSRSGPTAVGGCGGVVPGGRRAPGGGVRTVPGSGRRGGRTGSGRALGLLGVVLLHVVGCGAKLAISGPAPRAAPLVWSANEVVCVVQPADGRAGDTVYYGSGAAVAKRIADVIRAHRQVKVIPVGDRSDEPRACAARHGRYAVVPVVLRWERHSGALFYTESAKLELSLQR